MMFFQSFALGIMMEDGVQEIWRRISGTTKADEADEDVPLWKKIVGYVWTLSFLCIVAPWYGYPMALIPIETRWMVPYVFTEKIGVAGMGLATGIGALILLVVFKPEI